MVQTGLDVLISQEFKPLRGSRLGVLCNQASIAADLRHILDHFSHLDVTAVFGPQHGLHGHTQDNMIEWEGSIERRIFSLYGQHRKPKPEMLDGLDVLVIDLQDVGARYYTFIWTMALCMEACSELGIPVLVLDRPNPIGGTRVEGTLQRPGFVSFVGLHPLPMRHGMTIGEIAGHLATIKQYSDLSVVPVEGWRRDMCWSETGLTWTMPSPNMPTPDTAMVYPGGCLLEATTASEGRGTTRPFEMVGAPGLEGHGFCKALNDKLLPGVYFRPIEFQPTFNKHEGQLCEGAFVHVTDRAVFEPVLTYVAILQELFEREVAQWKQPPYEYELEKLPIDILAGNEWLRHAIEESWPLDKTRQKMEDECQAFESARSAALIYK